MRSAKFAEFLSGNGVDVRVIEGGYKAYRRLLTATFEKTWKLLVIGGKTGSGKTELLQLLGEMGHQVIDLERIAHHKGSAFGHMGQTPQPTTEQFQNNLWEEWNKFDDELPVLIEDESQAIGTVRIPDTLYKQMRIAQILNLEVDREERVERLVREYACFKDIALKENTLKLSKRLGGLEVKKAVCAIDQGDYHSVVRIVLAYYDKAYAFGLATREIATVNHLRLSKDDPLNNSKLIDQFIAENQHKLWTRSNLPNTVMVQDADAR
jgi:tRNA 2-selenouridine synthase